MFHNHSKKELVNKFVSIDTTFIDLFRPNNNNNIKPGLNNYTCNTANCVQYPKRSTNEAILSKDKTLQNSVDCFNNNKHLNEYKNRVFKISPSDFTVHLPETINNVIQMKVCAIDLPHPLFNISPHYKNNYLKILLKNKNKTSTCLEIELPTGSYTTNEILFYLNKTITDFENNKIKYKFFYNKILGKVFFCKNTNVNIGKVELHFSKDTESCYGPKKYMSLGTVLGFRKNEYLFEEDYISLNDENFIVKNGTINYDNEICNFPEFNFDTTHIPTITNKREDTDVIDDLVGKINQELGVTFPSINPKMIASVGADLVKEVENEFISYLSDIIPRVMIAENVGDNITDITKVASKIVRNIINNVFRNVVDDDAVEIKNIYHNPEGFIAEGTPTDNTSTYIWLVIDDFVKEQKTDYMVVSTNRSEINSSKIYCKIPIKNGKVQFDTSFFLDDYKREYFNPTNIDKLRIKLIEPSGLVCYFGHSNYNMDILFTCLR